MQVDNDEITINTELRNSLGPKVQVLALLSFIEYITTGLAHAQRHASISLEHMPLFELHRNL